MQAYGTHAFHFDLQEETVPAGQVLEVKRPIDVRTTKVFALWVKCTQACKINFDYLWEDAMEVLESTEPVQIFPHKKFDRFQFGTYQAGKVNYPMPGLFLRLRVDNTGSPENQIKFYGASQLQ